MAIINDNCDILQFKYVIFFLIMILYITIPVEGAIEQRGQILNISAGDNYILNAENCPGFYYSSSSGTYYESLPVKIEYNNPEMMDYGLECFNQGYSVLGWNGEKYAYLGTDREVVNIFLEEDKKILYPNEEYDLKEGYALKVTDLDSDNACLTLSRNKLPVYSSIISPGKSADPGTHTFLCIKKLNGVEVPLFSVYVDSVMQGEKLSAVNLKHILHFSDSPLELNYRKEFGELTVVETYPKLRLENKHVLWSGSDINVMEDIWIGRFEKETSRGLFVTFYPFMNKMENVESILPSVSSWSIPAMSVEEYLVGV